MSVSRLFRWLALGWLAASYGAATSSAAEAPPPAAATAAEAEPDEDIPSAPTAPDPAAAPFWEAMKLFRYGKPADWPRARQLLQEAADLEYTPAQNQLGLLQLWGAVGFKKDPKKAVGLFTLAASRGNAYSATNLGQCYALGTGVRKDRKKAIEWYTAAIDAAAKFPDPVPPADFFQASGDAADDTLSGGLPVERSDLTRAAAHFGLAEIYEAEGEAALAHQHYVKAATMGPAGRAGNRQAALKAAVALAFGQGVPRDLAAANAMLDQSKKLSRREGMVRAHGLVATKQFDDFAQADLEEQIAAETDKIHRQLQLDIAGTFADPKAKNYDAREAAKWYELAAENGDAWAMLALAALHHEGKLGASDPVKAFEWFKAAADKGNHLLAWGNLALCYHHGLGTTPAPDKAAEIFRAHANQSIICHLGAKGQPPPHLLSYEQELELLRVHARQKSDPPAQHILGLRYARGWGVELDYKDAASWFEKAAKAGHAPAWNELGLLNEWQSQALNRDRAEGLRRAADCYEKGAALNDPQAISNLAYAYSKGRGRDEDEARAANLYERALSLDPKNDRAHNNLGVIHETRLRAALAKGEPETVCAGHREKMLRHFREAAALGSGKAARNLGFLFYAGAIVPKDLQEAYTHLTTAADLGEIDARRQLGEMHEKGLGVPVTLREAAYHYRIAALGGDRDALVSLCDFYLAGKGVSRDFDRASHWLLLLAQRHGDIRAVMVIGELALRRQEYANALKLFRALEDLPNDRIRGYALQQLSRMYERGWGVKANPSRAKSYHTKALALHNHEAQFVAAMALVRAGRKAEAVPLLEKAAVGHPPANYTLGYLHLAGDGVPRDATKGIQLFRKAADAGNVEAQFALATLTLRGMAGAPTLAEAMQWIAEAEAAGYPKAKELRAALEKKQ